MLAAVTEQSPVQNVFAAVLSVSSITISQQLGNSFIVRAATFIWYELDLFFTQGHWEKLYSLPSLRVPF